MISSCGTWTEIHSECISCLSSFQFTTKRVSWEHCHFLCFPFVTPTPFFSTHTCSLPSPSILHSQHPQVKILLESWFLSWNEMDQSWAIDFYEVQLNPFCVRFELLHLVHAERSVFWGDYPTPLSSPGFFSVSIVPLLFILLKEKTVNLTGRTREYCVTELCATAECCLRALSDSAQLFLDLDGCRI